MVCHALVLLVVVLFCIRCGCSASTKDNYQIQSQNVGFVSVANFNNSKQKLLSGPILVIDKKTLFITNLKFQSDDDSNFWVKYGTGKQIVVPNEEGLYKLPSYSGENVFVRLPNEISKVSSTYFGIWKNKTKEIIDSITIPPNITVPESKGYERSDAYGRRIIRLKKCCPLGQTLGANGCQKATAKFDPDFDILENNKTHVDDTPLKKESMSIEPFFATLSCSNKSPLIPGEDRFALLSNGSLVVPELKRILTQDEFCIETIVLESDESFSNWTTTALWCLPDEVIRGGYIFTMVLGIGIITSIIFLLATAAIFLFYDDVIIKSARGRSIACFSMFMAISFICLAIVYFFTINGSGCTIIAFVFQSCLVSSFVWLSAVSWETLTKIRNYNNSKYTNDTTRFRAYVALSIVLPIVVILLSVIFDHSAVIPNVFFKPELGKSSCWFNGNRQRVLFFYVPIITIIVFNIICGAVMKWHLVELDKRQTQSNPDVSWITMKDDLKSMFRSCALLLSIMSICWVVEIISFFSESTHPGWFASDVITSGQGLFVFVVFVLHRPIKERIMSTKKKIQSFRFKTPPSSPHQIVQMEDFNFEPNNTTALLHHADNNSLSKTKT